MIKLFHTFCAETGVMNDELREKIRECCRTVVNLEDKFIELAFEMGDVEGMTPDDIKNYIRYIADWRLGQLKLEPIYGIDKHPLPWLTEILNGVEHANFFEAARHRIFQRRHQGRLARRRWRLVQVRRDPQKPRLSAERYKSIREK
jgi:ribonucleotide reductase beta subunit family protein with ferritin-like domain